MSVGFGPQDCRHAPAGTAAAFAWGLQGHKRPWPRAPQGRNRPAHNYSFDASSNLTALPVGGTGSYDKNGELTSATLSCTTTSYGYNTGGERLSAAHARAGTGLGHWPGITSVDPELAQTTEAYA